MGMSSVVKTMFSTFNPSNTTKFIIFVVLVLIWLANLRIFYKVKNQAAFITIGMCGLFILMMIFLRPIATIPLSRVVAAIAGFIGNLTGFFSAFFKYGIIFVESPNGSMTLQIDFECSGIIEIMVYIAILAFYKVYTVPERAILSAIGVIYIILINALRVVIIATMIHFGGESMYYIAHTYIGRIFFYAATVILYFYVFTKAQVVRMKVGSFSYDKGQKNDAATSDDKANDEKAEVEKASDSKADTNKTSDEKVENKNSSDEKAGDDK